MKFIKFKNYVHFCSLFFLFGLCAIFPSTIHAISDDDLDELFLSITPEDIVKLRASCEPGEAALWISFLTASNMQIPQLFDQDFYLKTSIPYARNLINYPNFLLCSYQDPTSVHQFTTHLFYNQTSAKNYTQTENDACPGTRIGSYINIENKTFLSLLENGIHSGSLPSQLSSLKSIDFPTVFKLLGNARLEERRMGAMFHYYFETGTTTYFEFKTPLLWMIRNLNFTEEEKQQIRDEFSAFQGDDFDEMSFAKKHVIMDALGLGTIELSLSHKLIDRQTWSLDVGGTLYLPSDVHFAQGLYGTYHEPKNQEPLLDLCDLVNITKQTTNPDLPAIVENYFFKALDHLSSALLQCQLGNNRHMSVALRILPYWQLFSGIEYNGLYIFEFFLPGEEQRFFVNKLPKTPFSVQFANSTLSDNDKLAWLEETLTQRLFPYVYNTKVWPGFIFTSASNFQKSYHGWNFTLGYNSWFKLQEKFLEISVPPTRGMDLDIDKSMNSDAWQIKLYGKVNRLIQGYRHDVSLSLWGDVSVLNNSIGNDFTFGISFDSKF